MSGLRPQLRSWLIVCIFFCGFTLVVGQAQPGRYDILKGNGGQSSCQLRDTVYAKCGGSTASPPLNVTPTPSLCTCNNVFFNIWSACSYASGNSTLPVFSHWTETCANSSIDLSASGSLTTVEGGLGINVPVWARITVPGNTSFDLQQAVVLASKPWSILQIVLPILAAAVSAVLTAVFLFIYNRKPSYFRWRESFLYRLRPVPKVKPVDQQHFDGWVIEQPSLNQHHQQKNSPSYGDDVPPPNTPETRPSDTVHGHPSIPSRPASSLFDSAAATGDATHGSASSNPGGRVYPFAAAFQQPANLTPMRSNLDPNTGSHSHTPSASSSSGLGWHIPTTSAIRSMRFPKLWKRGPVPIRETRPSKGFRMDGSTEGSMSTGNRSTLGSGEPERLRGSFDVRRHEDGADDFVEEPMGVDDEDSEDEGTNLITDEQRTNYVVDIVSGAGNGIRESGVRSSINASSATHDSSIDSFVRVIAPSTTSSESPRNTMLTATKPPSRYVPPPVVPPMPRQPAPIPPVTAPRMPRRQANNHNANAEVAASIPTFVAANRFMSPIQEIDRFSDRRTPSPVPMPPSPAPAVISRRPSNENPRPLPSTSNAHQRSTSHSASVSSSSIYEDESLNNSNHFRSISGDNPLSSRPLPGTHPSRPLPSTTHNRNPSLSALSPPHYAHVNQQSASASVSSLSNQLYPSREDLSAQRTPSGGSGGSPRVYPHDRGIDNDDAASFYLTADPPRPAPQPPSRSMSPLKIGRGDPEMLFPASVRGAGYRGTPN